MSNSVHSFLDGLTSYYHIGQRAEASLSNRQEFSSGVHFIPSYGFPFGYGGASSSGRHVNVIATGQDLETIRRHDREDREDQRQTSAAVIGGIGAIVLAGASAFFLKDYLKDKEELSKAQAFRNHILPTLDHRLASQIAPIANKHLEILEAKCIKSRNIALLTGGVLAAATAAFAGGMFAISWLITASVVAGVALAAIGAFTIVWHWGDVDSLPIEMQRKVQELQRQAQHRL